MATIPSEITWTTNQIVTAAQLNANLRDAINFIITPPLAILRQTVAQTVGNATAVPILFDTEDIDRDNGHSTTTNTSRYTAQTAGYYHIDAIIAWTANATGPRWSQINVNGVAANGRITFLPPTATSIAELPVSGTVFLNVGDYAEIYGRQDSGGNLNTTVGAPNQSSMTIRWVSTA